MRSCKVGGIYIVVYESFVFYVYIELMYDGPCKTRRRGRGTTRAGPAWGARAGGGLGGRGAGLYVFIICVLVYVRNGTFWRIHMQSVRIRSARTDGLHVSDAEEAVGVRGERPRARLVERAGAGPGLFPLFVYSSVRDCFYLTPPPFHIQTNRTFTRKIRPRRRGSSRT